MAGFALGTVGNSKESPMSRILLVEDDEALGLTLRERLERREHRILLAKDLKQAYVSLQSTPFDLVILDVGLPDGSGFDFAQKVKTFCETPFMFMTAQASAKDRLQGFELGAEEFLPKPFHLKEFLLRVHHVLKAHTNNRKLLVKGVEINFDSRVIIHKNRLENTTISPQSHHHHLSSKEFEVLKLMVDQSPMVVSRDEILEKVWGNDQQPSNRTIDNMVLHLRQKLGASVGECIQSVRGVGYQWISINAHGHQEYS